jgi:adenylate kinase
VNIILIGPPGVGKTTHTHYLSKQLGLPIILTSKVLTGNRIERDPVTKLVPDTIVNKLIFEKLLSDRYDNGFILEGYPRTALQASALCERFGKPIHVFFLVASKELLIKRILERTICPNCNRVYVQFDTKPETEGVCDDCGYILVKRDDDKINAIEDRIDHELSHLDQIRRILQRTFTVSVVKSDAGLSVISRSLLERIDPVLGESTGY